MTVTDTVPLTTPLGREILDGDLTRPPSARGLALFVSDPRSPWRGPRNRIAARFLREQSIATVLCDLLCPAEEDVNARTGQFTFDLELLSGRLLRVLERLHVDPQIQGLPVGLFGAGAGAATALLAASRRPDLVTAIACRSGRPELAGAAPASVRAPTLLMVGERDERGLHANRAARERLSGMHELRVIPGAGRRFDEPGAWAQVCETASGWFTAHCTDEYRH